MLVRRRPRQPHIGPRRDLLPKRGARHLIEPVPGEPGRFYAESSSAPGEHYLVDINEVEETNAGPVTGTCQCKGWSVRKTCSHLDDARVYNDRFLKKD